MATTFVSPGVYSREQDFTLFASRIGTTKLGLIGKFPKGPAFEVTRINSTDKQVARFGLTHHEYPATYVANSFLSQSDELYVTRVLGRGGFTNSPAWIITARFTGTTALGESSGATLAVIRSKKDVSGTAYFDQQTDLIIGGLQTGTTLGDFVLSGTTGPLTALTSGSITVSLDSTKSNYLAKVIGKNPKTIDGTQNIYVESIYPHFIREAQSRGHIVEIHPQLLYATTSAWTDYASDYSHATTPWIVSRVIGSETYNLFKVHTISDGDSANKEVKVSIANLDLTNNLFDIIVRKYEDNDANSFNVLERWSRLSMDPESNRFCAKIIGTSNDEYPAKSDYITLELAEGYPTDTVPAGFRGYDVRSYTSGSTVVHPQVYYKTSYFSGDSVSKTYLGLSELGYTSITSSQVSIKNAAQNIEHDLFVYKGGEATSVYTLKGFHMENTANATEFQVGNKASLTAYTTTEAGTTLDRQKLKFTVVPCGGFDGFNKYTKYENLYDEFTDAYQENVDVFKEAIDTMQAPESLDINILATPGIDYSNNETIVKYALEMVQNRADLLYIIDSPRLTVSDVKGTPEDAVSRLETTGIDTSYACTYWPWIQLNDTQTGRYIYMAPTYSAVRAMAFTDNKYKAWYAPAGEFRGETSSDVVRADVKLTKTMQGTLYSGRINPMVQQSQGGVKIMGQKTLQVKESALDRINVRRLFLRIQRLVAAVSQTLLFDPNDDTLQSQFIAQVQPILLNIQNQRGISGFKIKMDDSNNTDDVLDRNMLIGKIAIKPVKSAEFIDLTFQLLPTGANFNDF